MSIVLFPTAQCLVNTVYTVVPILSDSRRKYASVYDFVMHKNGLKEDLPTPLTHRHFKMCNRHQTIMSTSGKMHSDLIHTETTCQLLKINGIYLLFLSLIRLILISVCRILSNFTFCHSRIHRKNRLHDNCFTNRSPYVFEMEECKFGYF